MKKTKFTEEQMIGVVKQPRGKLARGRHRLPRDKEDDLPCLALLRGGAASCAD
jgi:hypothetical protein